MIVNFAILCQKDAVRQINFSSMDLSVSSLTALKNQHMLCVLYMKVLLSESMKPPKLKRYLETKHTEFLSDNTVQSTISFMSYDNKNYVMTK